VNTKIRSKLKGQVSLSRLQTFVIAFVVIGVAGTVGLDIMGSVQDNMTINRAVDNETFNATSSTYTYTVSEAADSDFYTLSSVTVYQSESQDNEITTVEIIDADAGKVEINSTVDSDLESIDYSYEDEDTQARQGASNAIEGMNELLGFLPVIGLVVAAAVVIGLVSGFGGSGRQRGRK